MKQAVILPNAGEYWFFFAYNDNRSHVRTKVFSESQLWDPAQWIVADVATYAGGSTLRYVSPTAYWEGGVWYPQVTWNAWPPTETWHHVDQGGLGSGLWTSPIDVSGPIYDYYLPVTEAGPNNVVLMSGLARDVANDSWVFKSFDGWTGDILDPPGEAVIFPDTVVWRQGLENSQILYRDGKLVAAVGGYRNDQYTQPTNPLLVVFRESTDGGLSWTDTTWVDQSLVPEIPGTYPGIKGHGFYSGSFFDGLIDRDGDLHFISAVVDSGCWQNTSYVHGFYDVHQDAGAWTASFVCDGTYQVTPDSVWDPRTELLGGDTWMDFPSLAEGEDGTLFAAWSDLVAEAMTDIWVARSHDGGNTWLPAVNVTETDENELSPRLVATATDSFVYVLTMYDWYDGPMDMIQVPVGFEVVPVELTSFTARAIDGGVLLEWATQSERDNYGFDVLRSGSEGGPYQRLNEGLIPGAGTMTIPRAYSFLDETVQPSRTYWYMLEDVSLSGERTSHGPVLATVPGISGLALRVLGGTEPSFSMQFMRAGEAALALYDIRGSRVATVWEGEVGAGESRVARLKPEVSPGFYTAVLREGERCVTAKVAIAR
jgi:hypothetical protein